MYGTVKEVSRVTVSTQVCVVTTREVDSIQLPFSRGNIAVITSPVVTWLGSFLLRLRKHSIRTF